MVKFKVGFGLWIIPGLGFWLALYTEGMILIVKSKRWVGPWIQPGLGFFCIGSVRVTFPDKPIYIS